MSGEAAAAAFYAAGPGAVQNNGCQEENGQKEMARLTRMKKTRRRMRGGQQRCHNRKGLWEMVSKDVWVRYGCKTYRRGGRTMNSAHTAARRPGDDEDMVVGSKRKRVGTPPTNRP
jgi:hypothetical protein